MVEVPLTQGKIALIDDCDAERVLQFNWQAFRTHRKMEAWYASRGVWLGGGKQTTELMHRFIVGVGDPAIQVDHWNSDGLDNQRDNLRTCNNQQNTSNMRKQSGFTSQFKGVRWHARDQVWQAYIRVNHEQHHLGSFPDEFSAALAYNDAAGRFFGDFARLNEVESGL